MNEDIEIQFRATKTRAELGSYCVYVAIPVHFFISRAAQKRLFRDRFNYGYGPKFLRFKFTDADLGMIQQGKKFLEIEECFMVFKFYLNDKVTDINILDYRKTIDEHDIISWIVRDKKANTIRVIMDLRLYFENECSFGLPELREDPETRFSGSFYVDGSSYRGLITHLLYYFRAKIEYLQGEGLNIASNLSKDAAEMDCTRTFNFLKLLKTGDESLIHIRRG